MPDDYDDFEAIARKMADVGAKKLLRSKYRQYVIIDTRSDDYWVPD